jgi:hypothetical protein
MSEGPGYHCADDNLMTGDVFVDARRHRCIETDDAVFRIEHVGEKEWNGDADYFSVKLREHRDAHAEIVVRDGKYIMSATGLRQTPAFDTSAEAWAAAQRVLLAWDAARRLGA